MPRKCTVCHHPERQEIERALLSGAPLSSLAARHRLSSSALGRHHQHLKARLHDAHPVLAQQREQEHLVNLATLLKLVVNAAEVFSQAGQHDLVLKSAREVTSLFKLMRNIEVQFTDLSLYNLLQSPDYISEGSIVTANPEVYAAERRVIAGNFTSPCNDLAPSPHQATEDAVPLTPQPSPCQDVIPTATAAPPADPPEIEELLPATAPPPTPSRQVNSPLDPIGHQENSGTESGCIRQEDEYYLHLALLSYPERQGLGLDERDMLPPARYRLRNPKGIPLYAIQDSLATAHQPR